MTIGKSTVRCWKSADDCCGPHPGKLKRCHRSSMNNELVPGGGIAKILSWLAVMVQRNVTHWPPLRCQCADWRRRRSEKQLIGHRRQKSCFSMALAPTIRFANSRAAARSDTANELIGGGRARLSFCHDASASPTTRLTKSWAERVWGLPLRSRALW